MTSDEAQAYCTALTKRSGSNFYYSFFFLPRTRRDAMYTIYAFCREVDNAVDEAPAGSDPHDAIRQWRNELAAAYRGAPTFPVTISLAEHARRLAIPRTLFEELIAGMEMDLDRNRYATFEDLRLYCYRVASVVGLICLRVFGTTSPLADDYAVDLGLAFQLTNILRDLGTDADRGRIYLPQDELVRFGYGEDAMLAKTHSPAFRQLMHFQTERAAGYYERAEQAFRRMPAADRRALLPAEIMRGIYSRILRRIVADEYRVFGPRITVSPARRLALATGIWLKSRFA
ncbi:MAG: squalene synthase HpnD [Proteobacteria bacterium HN_bin10]|nr:MAG: squalene synthase HpnD [Proteobacteria bacterium HN_bin10]